MKANIFYDKFVLHNMRSIARGYKEEKKVNKFNFGAAVTKLIESFPNDLPMCNKLKCIIDTQFENTKLFLYSYLAGFLIMYFIPFFILCYASSSLDGAAFYGVSMWFLLGALGMLLIEITAMTVDGTKKYLSVGWNYMDLFTFIFSIAFMASLIVVKNDHEKAIYYENILKLLKAFILLAIWIKITWFQKLSKNLGLL